MEKDKLAIDQFLKRIEKTPEEQKFLTTELKKCDLLRPLKADQFEAMISAMKKKGFGGGEFIIREDDEGDEIFVLEKGKIEVSYYDDDGSRQKLHDIDAPGTF